MVRRLHGQAVPALVRIGLEGDGAQRFEPGFRVPAPARSVPPRLRSARKDQLAALLAGGEAGTVFRKHLQLRLGARGPCENKGGRCAGIAAIRRGTDHRLDTVDDRHPFDVEVVVAMKLLLVDLQHFAVVGRFDGHVMTEHLQVELHRPGGRARSQTDCNQSNHCRKPCPLEHPHPLSSRLQFCRKAR